MMNWKSSLAESRLITKVAQRAVKVAKDIGCEWDFVDVEMDITACHLNGCPLDLDKMLSFDDANFLRDVNGIRLRLDRMTGELKDCFVPRCAAAVHA